MAAAQLSAQLSGKLSKSMAGAQSRVQFPKIGSPNPIRNQTTRTSHKEVVLANSSNVAFSHIKSFCKNKNIVSGMVWHCYDCHADDDKGIDR